MRPTIIALFALSASACVVTATTDPCRDITCTGGRVCRSGLCVLPSAGQPTYASCGGSLTCATDTCYSVTTTATTTGSYCSSTCSSSAACPGSGSSLGAACLMLAAAPGSPFLCYQGCATDLDCASGTSCIPVTGGAVGHVCMPGTPIGAGQPTYASCDGGLTCASPNTCYSVTTTATTGGSYCSSTCSTSAACPGSGSSLGAACLMLAAAPGSPFLCYHGCATDLDCASGTSCIPVTGGAVGHVCMPGSALATAHPDYDHCAAGSDCASGTCAYTTVTTTTGGSLSGYQCTEACSTSAACPDRTTTGQGAACLMIAGTASAFYCYQGCTYDSDCPGTGLCTPVTGGAVGHVCFPSG